MLKKAQTCSELLEEYRERARVYHRERLIFTGVEPNDVYNITAPFTDKGKEVIAGRVEERNSEFSRVMFFTQKDGHWAPREDTASYALQDPFQTRIHGLLVFGGTEVWPDPLNPQLLRWRTVFYKGRGIDELRRFAQGPEGMKDIRLVELEDGRIGVFTRPQGRIGDRGKIGFTIIRSLDDLNPGTIMDAGLIEDQFAEGEWGGTNEPQLLPQGDIGVLGHIACFDPSGSRHYYSMVFRFDPRTREASPIKIIARRSDFESGPSKRPDLMDVVFSGGLVRPGGNRAILYTGVSDAEAHRITIPDPFG